MTWNFILNPQAGGGQALRFWQQLKPLLSQHNIKHHFHQTQYQGHAKVLSRALAENGERAFVAIGGDGSVNELLQGIFESGCDLQEFVLTVAPQGTGNDWARYHHIPKSPNAWLEFLQTANVVEHDVGVVEYGDDFLQQHVFINMAGSGLDCHILQQMGCAGGKSLRYYSTLLSSLYGYQGRTLHFKCFDDSSSQDVARTVLLSMFCIGRYGGAGMDFSPKAHHQSGVLHAVFVEDMPFLQRLFSLPYLLNGKIEHHRRVQAETMRALLVAGEDTALFQCDGELIGALPARLTLRPCAIRVLTRC
ncbi:hypothetical protein QNE37_000392 [Vibrio vulnificus]|nr:hypothetical protein [Vibrio vulnificus]